MATPYNQVSRDAARALEEFSEEFRDALVLGEITPWAAKLGLVRTTTALKTTFPIPIHAAGYKELVGDIVMRSLYARSLSMTGKEWSDGVREKLAIIEAPDFIDWAGQPAAMAAEWARMPNELVAALLAQNSLDGPRLNFYDDPDSGTLGTRLLFADDHPYNVLDESVGTFENVLTCTEDQIADGTAFDAIAAYFRSILGPNGKPLGLRLTGGNLLVPATRENLFKNTLEFDTLIRAVTNQAGTENVAAVTQNNVYKKTFGYDIADELENQNSFYATPGGRPGLVPWVIQTEGQPKEIVHDTSSELYKASLQVGIAYVGRANAACALPQGIVRIDITG